MFYDLILHINGVAMERAKIIFFVLTSIDFVSTMYVPYLKIHVDPT